MMNEPLSPSIARGRTADIHAWGEGQVLKLFHDWFALEDIRYELRMARAVQASGLPVPQVGDLVQVGGRCGLVYQRVDGVSMMEMMRRKPWRLFQYARRMAELHAEMHAAPLAADLPSLHGKLSRKIERSENLAPATRARILERLQELPPGDRLCHGDFHPGNILMAKGGEVVIDWIDASLGDPSADVARTVILARGALETNQLPGPLMKASIRLLLAVYLRRYFRLRPAGKETYKRWLPVVAAGRLSEGITELEAWLVRQAAEGLK
jgi:uncharacterized protein (TIGR02172 family)